VFSLREFDYNYHETPSALAPSACGGKNIPVALGGAD
jgi:hypothetical protein